jgi:hypothetical protein
MASEADLRALYLLEHPATYRNKWSRRDADEFRLTAERRAFV